MYEKLKEADNGGKNTLKHLKRWSLGICNRYSEPRADANLNKTLKLVNPRVRSAYFSVIWNRTCTKRRFQNRGTCSLCKTPHSNDEVEHRPYCATIRTWANNILHLPADYLKPDARLETPLARLFGLGSEAKEESTLTKCMLLNFLAYTAHNTIRHGATLNLHIQASANDWAVSNSTAHFESQPASRASSTEVALLVYREQTDRIVIFNIDDGLVLFFNEPFFPTLLGFRSQQIDFFKALFFGKLQRAFPG